MDNKSGNCTPLRFYSSWFYFAIDQNNKDVFIVEYQNFEFFTTDADFQFSFYNTTCPEEPTQAV